MCSQLSPASCWLPGSGKATVVINLAEKYICMTRSIEHGTCWISDKRYHVEPNSSRPVLLISGRRCWRTSLSQSMQNISATGVSVCTFERSDKLPHTCNRTHFASTRHTAECVRVWLICPISGSRPRWNRYTYRLVRPRRHFRELNRSTWCGFPRRCQLDGEDFFSLTNVGNVLFALFTL